MKKIHIDLPEGLHFLEDYKELEPQILSYGTCVLNKVVTGCGATTMFLADPLPTILCSPRKALMFCKANSKRFKGRIYLFRNETDPDDAEPIDLMNRMMEYIRDCNRQRVAPKVLVSYDSFPNVARALIQDGSLGRFQIIVDEAQTLFTDAAFKGDVSIEFLENLQGMTNRIIYMSATPYLEAYLDMMPQFQNLPYVELRWKPSSLAATNIVKENYDNGRLPQTVKRLIGKYRTSGYFEEKIWDGNPVQAKEALFFLNNVTSIVRAVKANGLTPADTTIICAINDKNRGTLKQVGFEIGHAPQEGEPRTPFTFVTKCAFEGTDFWTQAYTYVFSDINVDSMVVDITLDLPQIMGRQRDYSNPFKYDATIFYKTDPSQIGKTDAEIIADITRRERVSRKWIANYNAADPELQENMAGDKRDQQEKHNFTKDYVAVIDDVTQGQRRVAFNRLAMCNEIRAWDLRKTTYFNGCQVLRAINDITVPDQNYPDTPLFLDAFMATRNFSQRMQVYCDFLDLHPEYLPKLESLPQVPMSMKEYYRVLGPDDIRSAGYEEAGIRRYMGMAERGDELDAALIASFQPGRFYSNPEVKFKLQGIYNALGFPLTAKATDLERQNVIPYKKQTVTIEGKRVEGYTIPQ
ncbi:MAG: hypothetical protein K5651_01610 [Bacteroidales bacterium]|nr:hypothetical protein [Bacteroidales bacterium]